MAAVTRGEPTPVETSTLTSHKNGLNLSMEKLKLLIEYVTDVLDDAKIYSSHANRKSIDTDDIKLAVQMKMDHSFTSPPPKDLLMEIARQKNSQPLPLVKPYCGPRLPPDRYCLSAPNYKMRTMKKSRNVQYGLHVGQRVGIGSQVKSVASPNLTVVTKSLSQPTVTILNKQPPAPKPTVRVNPALGAIGASGMTRIITPSASIGSIVPMPSTPSTRPIPSSTTLAATINPLKRKLEDDDYDNI